MVEALLGLLRYRWNSHKLPIIYIIYFLIIFRIYNQKKL